MLRKDYGRLKLWKMKPLKKSCKWATLTLFCHADKRSPDIRSSTMNIDKRVLINILNKAVGQINITTDMWTNKRMYSFMSATAHFVSKDSEKCSVLLDLCRCTERSTSDALWRQLHSILERFCIENKIGAVTIDNGANIVRPAETIGFQDAPQKPIIVRCSAHVTNIAVKDGLAYLTEQLHAIRELIKKIKRTPYLK